MKIYIIHSHILCKVVKYGLDILEVVKKVYDLPQLVIIYTYLFSLHFTISRVMVDREIYE
jgi:hypothetical protein